MLHGVIFDLDGTLVDSGLDFDAMRRDMGLPPDGPPLLEAIEELDPVDADRCREILLKHEREGAARATPMPGVVELLQRLTEARMRLAIVTRNCREIALATLARLPAKFWPIVAREDGPFKPDPWAIRHICQAWGTSAARVAMVGDYRFDVECGKNAGARTVFYSGGIEADRVPPEDHAGADLILPCFRRVDTMWNWLAKPA